MEGIFQTISPPPLMDINNCIYLTSYSVDIVFIGPVGSGKSSLVGSIFRAVNEEAQFPDKVRLTLNHPDEPDSHGTMHWLETKGNTKGTILYQDTRGDQVRGKGNE